MTITVDKGGDIVTTVKPADPFLNNNAHRFTRIDRRAHCDPVSATSRTYPVESLKNNRLRNRVTWFALHTVAVREITGSDKQQINSLDCGDSFNVVHPFLVFDHHAEQRVFVGLI